LSQNGYGEIKNGVSRRRRILPRQFFDRFFDFANIFKISACTSQRVHVTTGEVKIKIKIIGEFLDFCREQDFAQGVLSECATGAGAGCDVRAVPRDVRA